MGVIVEVGCPDCCRQDVRNIAARALSPSREPLVALPPCAHSGQQVSLKIGLQLMRQGPEFALKLFQVGIGDFKKLSRGKRRKGDEELGIRRLKQQDQFQR